MTDPLADRWKMLALLFAVRVAMAFQFQTVAALSPFMMTAYGIGLADIGLLIGLYLSPGLLFALPGAAIGRRFGDKHTVAFALVLMLAGGVLIASLPTWEAQVAGRVLAGIGGVVLNVMMTKMVSDWFGGKGLSTAMGIFVNSWPAGIALGLLVLPVMAQGIGLSAALWLTCALIAVGLGLLLAFYRAPGTAAGAAAPARVALRGPALSALLCAGGVWGLYNAALGMVFSFGPLMLTQRGWSTAAASSTTSIVLWVVVLAIPLGGLIADRFDRRDLVLSVGLASFAGLILLAPETEQTALVFIALGVAAGLAAGPIMSLPAEVLSPGNRVQGMGLYWTMYYVGFVFAPITAGALSDVTGSADVTFAFGAAMLVAALALSAAFKVFARRTEKPTIA